LHLVALIPVGGGGEQSFEKIFVLAVWVVYPPVSLYFLLPSLPSCLPACLPNFLGFNNSSNGNEHWSHASCVCNSSGMYASNYSSKVCTRPM
jgi:hypothetical protein